MNSELFTDFLMDEGATVTHQDEEENIASYCHI